MPPPRTEVRTLEDFGNIVLQMHAENQREMQQLRTILLDFNERLAVNEMSMKNADTARLMLLESLNRLMGKMDTLQELPGDLRRVSQDVSELKMTVRSHEVNFQQMAGGWKVARYSWIALAAIVSFLVSFGTQWFLKKGP
jgi:hypothetical protein